MAKVKRQSKPPLPHGDEGMTDAVYRMEPELRQMDGVLATLRIFGEAQDSIEPAALATLARSTEEAVVNMTECWRLIFEAVAAGKRKPAQR
jgi:hypothetical protein